MRQGHHIYGHCYEVMRDEAPEGNRTVSGYQARCWRGLSKRREKWGWRMLSMNFKTIIKLNNVSLHFCYCFIFLSSPEDMLRERGRRREKERERNINVREIHRWVCLLHVPNQGSNPQPRYVPWLGIKPVTLQLMERYSNQLSLTGQGQSTFSFLIELVYSAVLGSRLNWGIEIYHIPWVSTDSRLPLFLASPQPSGTFVTVDEVTLTHHCQPEVHNLYYDSPLVLHTV